MAGLVMTADWMGSDQRWHPVAGPEDRPAQAEDLLKATMWAGGLDPEAGDILGGRPRMICRRQIMDLPLSHLLIAEAPTGEGKTEAALLWLELLVLAGLVDGMYFARADALRRKRAA